MNQSSAYRLYMGTLFFSLFFILFFSDNALAQTNPIIEENNLPGTTSWELAQPNRDFDVLMRMKGFTSPASINKGESIDFHIHVSPAQTYTAEIYRIGWYNGDGARLMQTIGPLNGSPQSSPTIDRTTGMVKTDWPVSYTLNVPSSWTSGMYLVKLENNSGYENYMVFTVRDDTRRADFLYQHAITTSHAYNNFPDDGSLGKSLYDYNSYGANTPLINSARAIKVSFDRPFADDGAGLLFNWEFDLIQWLEREGYDVAYSTDIDLHNNPASILNYTGFIAAGHDEYWTHEMFNAAEAARDAGVHLAFAGANAAYWQSRLEDNNRTLVVYKDALLDPIYNQNPGLATDKFRDVGRPEQTLIGIQYRSYVTSSSNNTAYIIQNPSHWAYENTNFTTSSQVPNIVGYEIDNVHSEYAGPPDNGTQVFLSNSRFVDHRNDEYFATSSIYQASSGAWVFASGTMSWSWALNRDGYINAGIQQTTRNVLDRFIEDSNQPDPTLLGDTNCSGDIDSVDALFILQYEVGLRDSKQSCPLEDSTKEINTSVGDVDGNSTVNVVDALFVLQCVVEIPNVFCPQ